MVEERIRAGDKLDLVISPFVKREALVRLSEASGHTEAPKIICRWRMQDLMTGVTDLEVYEYLVANGSRLSMNPQIHLKLYVFESNMALCTSANLTLSGLGYIEGSNLEAGCMLKLDTDDWLRIYSVISGSTEIDRELYDLTKKRIADLPKYAEPDSPEEIRKQRGKYSILSLPASENPEKVFEVCRGTQIEGFSAEGVRRAAHDVATFGIDLGLRQKCVHGETWECLSEHTFCG